MKDRARRNKNTIKRKITETKNNKKNKGETNQKSGTMKKIRMMKILREKIGKDNIRTEKMSEIRSTDMGVSPLCLLYWVDLVLCCLDVSGREIGTEIKPMFKRIQLI